MPTFVTPEPITVELELAAVAGGVWLTAGDRAETVVEVRPSNPAREADVWTAANTGVEYDAGRLLVSAPRDKAPKLGLFGKRAAIDVEISLPVGSSVQGSAARAGFRAEGRLGDCRFTTAAGPIRLDQTDELRLKTGFGDIAVTRARGSVDLATASGEVRIGAIEGAATIKSGNGGCWLGEVTGDLRVRADNGGINVDRAGAGVMAKSANGSVRIGELARGTAVLQTDAGEIEFGIRRGTAARLDVATQSGIVRNALDPADGPAPTEETVEVRARTAYGDIVIRRAQPVFGTHREEE